MADFSQEETDFNRLYVEQIPAIDPKIGRALWHLEAARGRLKGTLAGLDETLLDWEPYPGGNSIGTLLYHIAAIELDWLYCEVLEADFPPAVEALLPYPVRDETGRLFVVTAVSLTNHLHRLDTARQILLNVYAKLTLADFRRARELPRYHVTPEWVLFHLTQHETEHRGQMQENINWSIHHGRKNSQSL
jgi:uncharacterized damage-inducible protein DinB